MLSRSFAALMIVALAGCDLLGAGTDAGFYLRFEPVEGPVSSGSSRPLVLGDAVWWTTSMDMSGRVESGDVRWPVAWATVVNGVAYGLARDGGGVVKTADGQSFEVVSAEVFDNLGSVDGRLVALRRKSIGRYAMFISEDLGASWRATTDLTAGFEVGDGDNSWITREAGGRLRATIDVFALDERDNANRASQTYDITADEAVVVGRTGNPEVERTPSPFPDFVSDAGLGFFPNRDSLIQQLRVGDMTSLTVIRDPGPAPDIASGVPLRWALANRGEQTLGTELTALGVDTAGRLLVASSTQIYRTLNPLSDDERADILRGPGCAGRSSWYAEWSDDTTDVIVTNNAGRRLQMWSIDTEMGWTSRGTVEADAEAAFFIMRNTRLMFTAPEDDTCIAVHTLPDEQTATLTVQPL
jgi:hypothetical protein